ncbi:prenyltransferase/squalene oxidase repeat-containing protein [Acrocarpospora catenulata]|uniref:prenyltransferase/squalene oxidase repeat-containing protein n=1 Tax=Acrocarpospora catenulata TaxID=2836182 RepID=UPI0027DF3062|nr:prenyltransferase/squalene oxidase repeat-containing protein [Acrocarpospora catenulata]
MSIHDLASPRTDDAQELVQSLMSRPWGQVSPSIYETGRLVSLTPWLVGHAERVDFLLTSQGADGAWGAPDGYGLVPTLSATEAILAVLHRGDALVDREVLEESVTRALGVLSRWLTEPGPAYPDMPAIELIVPYLITLINDRVSTPLPLPEGMSGTALLVIRRRLASGVDLPDKLLHALEIGGDAASGAPAVHVTPIGTVGASPAATAAWLGDRGLLDKTHPARRHLEAVARRHGGPVPVGMPITVFERGWVLSWLRRAGIPFDVPPEMVADLRAAIGPAGTPAGAGLPADADTTAVALYALAALGEPYDPASLRSYETDTHFCTWPGEQGFSVSVNAHVLDAFGLYAAGRGEAVPDYYRTATEKLAKLLRDHQRPDGSWADRWHASPYYATVSCALALEDFGGEQSAPAVQRAVRWVLDTQGHDGSWGRWGGTREETAYAIQILLLTRPTEDPRHADAVADGYAYLERTADAPGGPALWHDKDLYLPLAIVRAAVLAARYLAARFLGP